MDDTPPRRPDWCDTSAGDCLDLFDPPVIQPGAKVPFPYGQVWLNAGSWIDPHAKTVHLED